MHSPSHDSSPLYTALIVILFHMGFLGFAIYWPSSPISTPKKTKVFVQTITLSSTISAPTLPNSTFVDTTIAAMNSKEAFVQEKPLPVSIKKEPSIEEKEERQQPFQEAKIIPKTPSMPTEPPKKVTPTTPPTKATSAASKNNAKALEKNQSTPEIKKKPVTPPIEKNKASQEISKPNPIPAKENLKNTPPPTSTTNTTKKQKEEHAAAKAKQQLEMKEQEKRQQAERAALEIARQEFAKATEKLETIGKKTQAPSSASVSVSTGQNAVLPKEISSLTIDSFLAEGNKFTYAGKAETTYLENISFCLRKKLRLPDYGFVSVKLTIEKTGKVTRVEIVKSGSSLNKAYIEKELPKLIFSPFGAQFQGVDQYTFLITIHNE